MPEKTCGDCAHFFPHPKDVRTYKLGEPSGGECRVEPPKIVKPIMGQNEEGQFLAGMLVSYLLLQDAFPACGKFCQSEERKDKFQIQLGKK